MNRKRSVFIQALLQISKALYHLLLLAVYVLSKFTETLAGFLSKVSEKLLKN